MEALPSPRTGLQTVDQPHARSVKQAFRQRGAAISCAPSHTVSILIQGTAHLNPR